MTTTTETFYCDECGAQDESKRFNAGSRNFCHECLHKCWDCLYYDCICEDKA